MTLTPDQKKRLVALAGQRPDLIEMEGPADDPSFEIDPGRVSSLAVDDTEGLRVLTSFFCVVATDAEQGVARSMLAKRLLLVLELAATRDAELAADVADELGTVDTRDGSSLGTDVELARRRIRAIADGAPCGCALRPVPYRFDPEQYPLLEARRWEKISEEGYVTRWEQRPTCTRCGGRFLVRKTRDYDRSTWSWEPDEAG